MLTLRRTFSPARYRFGRPVAALCGFYLALLTIAAVFAVADAVMPDPTTIGASFATLPLVVLSAPASILMTPAIEPVESVVSSALPVSGTAWSVGMSLLLLAMGVGQAAVVFLLLRGPRDNANLTLS